MKLTRGGLAAMITVLTTHFAWQGKAQSSTYTNLVVAGINQSITLNVSTGQLARVLCVNGLNGNGAMTVTVGSRSFLYSTINYTATGPGTQGPPIVAGPAAITLTSYNIGGSLFCTIELVSPSEPLTPSSAVVIPADSGGPVEIILESSTDLITWTAALPGTYGTSTTKRFFRVRGQRLP